MAALLPTPLLLAGGVAVAALLLAGTALVLRHRRARRSVDPDQKARPVAAVDRTDPQCPDCGGFESVISTEPAHHRCVLCGHTWTWVPGQPWPRTVGRPDRMTTTLAPGKEP